LAITEFKVENAIANDLVVRVNNKSITLSSLKLKNISLFFDNGNIKSIVEYLNDYGSYIINFEDIEIVYKNRKLFRDTQLLGNIDYFIQTFESHDELNMVRSEKGNFSDTSSVFDSDSIFGFVENKFISEYDYFICDDLGNEWADHIGLNENNVSFFISKHNTSTFSATSFQEAVGQALKNLGNILPVSYQLNNKKDNWNKAYKNDNVQTLIQRLRKGDSVESAIEFYRKVVHYPNIKKNIYLVVNFISRHQLKENLEKLKQNQNFREKIKQLIFCGLYPL
jgi:hypothetical protein